MNIHWEKLRCVPPCLGACDVSSISMHVCTGTVLMYATCAILLFFFFRAVWFEVSSVKIRFAAMLH